MVVDCRVKSKTFGKCFSIILSANKNKSLYIPSGFAHGFCSLSNNTILHYKCTNYRDKNSETGIIWNDKTLKIKWPIKNPIVSSKDKKNYIFKDFIKKLRLKSVKIRMLFDRIMQKKQYLLLYIITIKGLFTSPITLMLS